MKRLRKLKLSLCCILLGLAAHAEQKPNFIFILADDLGYGDLSSFGHDVIKTPHLDQLAKDGARYTSFYCPAPLCSPSRAATLTGKIPDRVGIYSWIPPRSEMQVTADRLTIAKVMKESGYATALLGKYHGNGKFNSPEQAQLHDIGFDYWFATHNNASPSQKDPENFYRNGEKLGKLEGYSSQLIVDDAMAWLDSLPEGQPYGLFVWFHAPHTPLAAAPEFTEQYEGHDGVLYYANVAEMDHHIGRLMDFIDARGERDNTFVAFSSDNGPAHHHKGAAGVAGPLNERKWSMHEGGVRVPGIIRWPSTLAAGQESNAVIGAIDFLPFVSDVLGYELPNNGDDFDGESFLPLMQGEDWKRNKPMYWQKRYKGEPKAAFRSGKWKLLGNYDPEGKLIDVELYDLDADISESNNLVANYPEVVQSMKLQMEQAHQRVEADAPKWPRPGLRKGIKAVTASSQHEESYPEFAADGDETSRWESNHQEEQSWIEFELIEGRKVKGIKIQWEDAAARDYTIEVSKNRSKWIEVARKEGVTERESPQFKFKPTWGRYVRINCHEKLSEYGYSIYEVKIW